MSKMSEEFKGGEKLKFVRNEAEKDVDKMSKDLFEQMEKMDHIRKFEMMMKDIRCDGRKLQIVERCWRRRRLDKQS